jgi:hypothetical protein
MRGDDIFFSNGAVFNIRGFAFHVPIFFSSANFKEVLQ